MALRLLSERSSTQALVFHHLGEGNLPHESLQLLARSLPVRVLDLDVHLLLSLRKINRFDFRTQSDPGLSESQPFLLQEVDDGALVLGIGRVPVQPSASALAEMKQAAGGMQHFVMGRRFVALLQGIAVGNEESREGIIPGKAGQFCAVVAGRNLGVHGTFQGDIGSRESVDREGKTVL